MISRMPLFQVYGAMARHAAETQRVSASNVANADRPGYKAVELESFDDFLNRVQTRPVEAQGAAFKTFQSVSAAAPNGNTVSLEIEMIRSAEAAGQHDLAMTVYSKSIDLLRAALGKRA